MLRKIGATFAVMALVSASAIAQEYPQRPVKLIVPFPPGGVTDIAARVVGQKMSDKWGQQVVVENRSGAAGIVGVQVVQHAAADGYTLLVTSGDFVAINPAAYAKLDYDANKDFTPIAMITNTPLVLVSSPKAGIKNIKDLVAAAKAKPGELGFSTPGNGSTNHVTGELLSETLGIKLLHVPYRGGSPAATAVASGEVPLGIIAISTAKPFVGAGSMTVVGIANSKRMESVADWPTLDEAGAPGFQAALWVGLWGPAGVPPAIVKMLHDEIGNILHQQEIRDRLATLGAQPFEMTTAEFVAYIKSEQDRFGKVVRQANIRIE